MSGERIMKNCEGSDAGNLAPWVDHFFGESHSFHNRLHAAVVRLDILFYICKALNDQGFPHMKERVRNEHLFGNHQVFGGSSANNFRYFCFTVKGILNHGETE